MTGTELLAIVPVHERNGHPCYVDLSEIPQPWRDQFRTWLRGAHQPGIEGVEIAAYIFDWKLFVGRCVSD